MQFHAYPLIAAAALGFASAAPALAQDTQAPADAPSTIETPATTDAPQTQAEEAPDAQPADAPEPTAPLAVEPSPGEPAAETPGSEAPAEQSETPGATTPEEGAAAAPDGAAPAASGDVPASEVREIVRDTFGEWEVRCLPDGADCFMYQLALDAQQNPVAEVSLLKLPAGSEAVAGVTVVTPLGTLLNEGVAMQIDGGERQSFPFNWCSQVGCFARFGLNEGAIGTMKRGQEATMTVISVAAPDEPISVPVSLDGFTAAYDSLVAPN